MTVRVSDHGALCGAAIHPLSTLHIYLLFGICHSSRIWSQIPTAIMWIFYQSSGHTAFKEDALNANKMNVGTGGPQHRRSTAQEVHSTGGAQPRMRDTVWDGRVHKMVLGDEDRP